ncbi:2-hydroxychromene-2-carboxylate isomerase [Lysobacter enzymogenes]|uniref:2-hydroxychromene-2-carboxylate isomerase n=1 Tax=Lysobacter enzymogenes TaxID=69 RepID=UPI001A95BE3F|nr:2-hydroxychromene-2-carboxylate isomerase [Lysobacter enzymogenes]QQP94479.1 2-hydroxychromene-2-carboxylate isomerase [Lysobacter enzymogenes]
MDAPALRWYFDFISPFSYLQWRKLRELTHERAVALVPVAFGAVLSAHSHKGPAEIPGKREFTYQHVLWQARRDGVALRFPPAHPFNPLAALRLCVAAGSGAAAVDAIFDWIWRDGRAGDSVDALAPVAAALGVPAEAIGSDAVKAALRANTESALLAGVFGVPTLSIGAQLFWGNDAHEFALDALQHPELLEDPEMQRLKQLPVGVQRRG